MTEIGDNRIIIAGAGEHNLRIERLEIPRESFVVVSGPSGAGKSSLVFDTLYREAVRRSAAVRGGRALLKLQRIEPPKVERIENLSYPVAVKARLSSARLTSFASLARLFPLIRALFAQLAERHCSACGALLNALELRDVLERLSRAPVGSAVLVLAPLAGAAAERSSKLAALASRGFTRIYSQGELVPIEDAVFIADPEQAALVIDSFKWSASADNRVIEAVQTALDELGSAHVLCDGASLSISAVPRCAACGSETKKISADDFSYFSPQFACERCAGLGQTVHFEEDELASRDGQLASWIPVGLDVPHAASTQALRGALERCWISSTDSGLRQQMARHGSVQICPECRGARVRRPARVCELGGLSFSAVFSSDVAGVLGWAERLAPAVNVKGAGKLGELLQAAHAELVQRLKWLGAIGLDYLALNRAAASLSSGELYRAELSRYLARPLTGLLCLLDEPASGLHPRDLERLLEALHGLVKFGNSLIVVEHHPLVIRSAGYLIELGPGGGPEGGTVVAQGTPEALLKSPSSTGAILRGESFTERRERRLPDAQSRLTISGARKHNLKVTSAGFPHGAVSVVAGVSGSGKSTLVFDCLGFAVSKLIAGEISPGVVFKQSELSSVENWEVCSRVVDSRNYARSRSRRSTVATVAGIMPELRMLYAKTRAARVLGLTTQNFSFNSAAGWCEECRGLGLERYERTSRLELRCPACEGSRFNKQLRLIDYRGLTLPALLALTVAEAAQKLSAVFGKRSVLSRYVDFGLGYLRLDQSAAELSLGERQRVRLIADIGRGSPATPARRGGRTLYLFDEPCRGLHVSEVARLLRLLFELADEGHTIIAVEHHPDFVRAADFVMELGPGAGSEGGEVIFSGSAHDYNPWAE